VKNDDLTTVNRGFNYGQLARGNGGLIGWN
jgi:hypothetical protein